MNSLTTIDPAEERTPGKVRLSSRNAPDLPAVSVIIPLYKSGEDFERSLAAVLAARRPGDEVIIVSDSDPEEGWRIATRHDDVEILLLEQRSGPAAARNAGAELAQNEVLFFVDADVVVPPDAVNRVRAAFGERPDLQVLVGSYDAEPADPGFHSRYRNLLHHYVHQTARSPLSTFWAGCGAIRRSAFLEVGGFDEHYEHPSIEDIEMGYRLTNAGYRIEIDKGLQVRHLKRWSPGQMVRTDLLSRATPWTRLLLRRGTMENNLNLSHGARLSTAIAAGLLPAALLGIWQPVTAVVLLAILLATLVAANAGFYSFLARTAGTRFALRALPWHLLYFLICAAGFGLGLVLHIRDSVGSKRPAETTRGLKWEASTHS